MPLAELPGGDVAFEMGNSMKFTATARRLGIFSVAAIVILLVAYAVTLAVGLLSLESPQ